MPAGDNRCIPALTAAYVPVLVSSLTKWHKARNAIKKGARYFLPLLKVRSGCPCTCG